MEVLAPGTAAAPWQPTERPRALRVRAAAKWPWRLLAGLLIGGAAALHLAYLTTDCPLDLAPDEAHYWDWSRHLDWSYYSKGPLVAYLIRAGVAVAGPWAQSLAGSEMPAVRLPAVLCGSLLLAGLYVLTVQVYGRERLAVAVVALGLTLPVLAAGSSLMTIDAPYTCCWAWALVLGHRAIFRGSAWAWPAAGLVVGLGILAKYTMVLWLLSAVLFLAATRSRRRLLMRPGFWVLAGVAAVCCLPLVVWNANNGWVSLRHVGGQSGLHNSQIGMRWLGPAAYLGVQALLLLGFWFVAWLAAMTAYRPSREPDDGVRYLWWTSAPVFVFFLLFSLRTAEEPNWPVTAYLSGMVLTTAWLADQLRSPRRRYLRWTALGMACGLGLALTLLMHHSEWARPLLARVSGPPTVRQPLPLRRFDPTCRLRGWRTLAAAVDQARAELRTTGVEAELASTGWTLPGELAFYCQGHPMVYSFGLALGDRHSQYDLWRPNPTGDPGAFAGRTFIVVGEAGELLQSAFERVEPVRRVFHREAGEPIASWGLWVCRGFRGFRDTAPCGDRY
jgi:4-amino-4-deoxy-L-arabinose transferase-like glycosyltransferase